MPVYTSAMIAAFESCNGMVVPDRLAAFLQSRGSGVYGAVEIHDLGVIFDRYAEFFDDPAQIFSRYLPFGCNNDTQGLWVLDLSRERAKFAKIWHETVPDDWTDETWRDLADTRDPELEAIGI
jgi:hypothetical protein